MSLTDSSKILLIGLTILCSWLSGPWLIEHIEVGILLIGIVYKTIEIRREIIPIVYDRRYGSTPLRVRPREDRRLLVNREPTVEYAPLWDLLYIWTVRNLLPEGRVLIAHIVGVVGRIARLTDRKVRFAVHIVVVLRNIVVPGINLVYFTLGPLWSITCHATLGLQQGWYLELIDSRVIVGYDNRRFGQHIEADLPLVPLHAGSTVMMPDVLRVSSLFVLLHFALVLAGICWNITEWGRWRLRWDAGLQACTHRNPR